MTSRRSTVVSQLTVQVLTIIVLLNLPAFRAQAQGCGSAGDLED